MLQVSERFKSLLLLSILLASGSLSAATKETRWYDVEVILFAQKSQSYRESEVWPIDYTLPDIANARDLIKLPEGSSPPKKPMAFRELNPDELKLNDDAERIDKASDLELLSHFGWRQPGLPDDEAVAVKVSIPAREDEESSTTMAKQQGSVGTPAGTDGGAIAVPAMPPRLEGTLKLILSRYLHIDADLLYREPLHPGDSEEQAPMDATIPAGSSDGEQTALPAQQQDLFMMAEQAGASADQPLYRVYRMQQSRRMRSGELHYLDHPVFGLAVLVTPYEPPAKAETAQPAQ